MTAVQFYFQADNKTVTDRLNATERGEVTTWQTHIDYSFEFHDGHATGNPIYIRPEGNKDKSNLTKIDTKNKSPEDYHGKAGTGEAGRVSFNTFANGEKLAKIKSASQIEIQNIVANSWDKLALLADRHWNNIPAPLTAQQIAAAAAAAPQDTKPCTKTGCTGQVPFYGKGKKAMCPTCGTFS